MTTGTTLLKQELTHWNNILSYDELRRSTVIVSLRNVVYRSVDQDRI